MQYDDMFGHKNDSLLPIHLLEVRQKSYIDHQYSSNRQKKDPVIMIGQSNENL